MSTTVFTAVGRGFQEETASAGQVVSFVTPAGCALMRNGVAISASSPFTHEGPDATYRIDCVTHEGTPKIATLTITGGGA